MICYLSVFLLLIGMIGMVTGAIWTLNNKNKSKAHYIGMLCGFSVALMVNSCLLLYVVVHQPSMIALLVAIIITELLSYGGYFVVNGIMQSLNEPDMVDKTLDDFRKEKQENA